MRIHIEWRNKREDTIIERGDYQAHTTTFHVTHLDEPSHSYDIPWDIVQFVERQVDGKKFFFEEKEAEIKPKSP